MSDRPAETYRFEGFGAQTIEWFEGLEKENSKTYFEANRHIFEEQIREPMRALLMETSVRYRGDMKLFRQNRDIRFSKDKSPYKTATYGIVAPEGTGAALYASISAQGLHVLSGYYQIASDQVDRFRRAVDNDTTGTLLETIVRKAEESGLTVEGDSLKTAPRGYAKDHPRLRFLRMKDIIYGAWLAPGPSLYDRGAFDFALATWKTGEPLTRWMDAHVGPSTQGHDSMNKPKL